MPESFRYTTASEAPLFFRGTELKPLLKLALGMGGFAALVNTLSEINIQTGASLSAFEVLQQYALFASCSLLGLIFCRRIGLECFLLRRSESRWRKLSLLVLYGGAIGVSIGIAYHHVFAPYRFSPRVPLWIRLIQDAYDSFIYSLRAAVAEELVFRLLLFGGFFYVLKRVFDPLIRKGYSHVRWIPLLFSLILSSLLFGMAHGIYGFASAFLAGLALCICFLRAGIEGAVLCHFLADFVFYNLTYLQHPWK
jgi:membrane protease YdiL (CAAX protease family)